MEDVVTVIYKQFGEQMGPLDLAVCHELFSVWNPVKPPGIKATFF